MCIGTFNFVIAILMNTTCNVLYIPYCEILFITFKLYIAIGYITYLYKNGSILSSNFIIRKITIIYQLFLLILLI